MDFGTLPLPDIAALVVFPLAAFIPATSVHLDVQWPLLLTLLPLTAITGEASLRITALNDAEVVLVDAA